MKHADQCCYSDRPRRQCIVNSDDPFGCKQQDHDQTHVRVENRCTSSRQGNDEMDQTHLGVAAWLDPANTEDGSFLDPEELMELIASALAANTRGLTVPRDDREVWFWLGVDGADLMPSGHSLELADLPAGVRLAVGGKPAGVAGFRRTHRQAQEVKGVSLQAQGVPHRVTTFAQLGPIAMMSHDMSAMRSWAGEVLGSLGTLDDRSSRLRESLLVFLEHNCSYAAAAAELRLHRHTMLHRVRSAKELLDRDDYDHLNTQLALTAVRWLRSTALPQ